jgi:predicted transcriptional regulator
VTPRGRPRRGARGGKGGAEPRLRVRRREAQVVQLATEGRSQHEIARTVGISQPAVCQIVRRVDERWLRDRHEGVARHKAEQTRKLDYLYREAAHAWEQSKAQKTRRRQRKTEGQQGDAGGGVAELIVDDSHGDPRYLEAARHALADLARLWGVSTPDAPAGPGTDLPAVFMLTIGDERTAPEAVSKRSGPVRAGERR